MVFLEQKDVSACSRQPGSLFCVGDFGFDRIVRVKMEVFEAQLHTNAGILVPTDPVSLPDTKRKGSLAVPFPGVGRRCLIAPTGTASSGVAVDIYAADCDPELRYICDRLNLLWSDEDPCNVILMVNGQQIYAHRNVLISYSPYFRAMLAGGLAESQQTEVELHDFDPSTVEAIVNFAYTGRISINHDNAQGILQASSMMDIQPLLVECCRFFYKELDPSNCLGIAHFADMFSCSYLAQRACNYARINFQLVVENEEFQQLPVGRLLVLLGSPYLFARTENDVYRAAVLWLREDVDSRLPHFTSVLEKIHLHELSEEVHCSEVQAGDLVLKYPDCSKVLLREEKLEKVHSSGTRRELLREMLVTVGGLTPTGLRQDAMEAYAPVSDCWFNLPSMPVKRSAMALAVVDDLLYVTGGTDGQKVIDSVQRYDPRRHCWETDLPPMLSTRAYHGLVGYNGTVLALGGWNKHYEVLEAVEYFDPFRSTWYPRGSMRWKRRGMGVAEFRGLIYVCGGHDGLMTMKTVESYDYRSGKWESGSSMRETRADLSCCVVGDYLYAFGGSRGSSSSCERCRPGYPWEPVAPMNHPRPHAPLGAQAIDQYIYVFGGSDRNCGSVLEKYDTVTDTWTTCHSMACNRCDTGLVVLRLAQEPQMEKGQNLAVHPWDLT